MGLQGKEELLSQVCARHQRKHDELTALCCEMGDLDDVFDGGMGAYDQKKKKESKKDDFLFFGTQYNIQQDLTNCARQMGFHHGFTLGWIHMICACVNVSLNSRRRKGLLRW